MDTRYDTVIIIVIGVILAIWAFYSLRAWLEEPEPLVLRTIPLNEDMDEGPAVNLLEKAGYDVVGGKMKIPLAFKVNGNTVHSRLFIDYVAVQNSSTYMVKTARRKKPMEWSGPELRDRLMPYLLLYPGCAGVLYVDTDQQSIRLITLVEDLEEEEYED
ncbi:hypothetical protein ACFQ5D_11695 [Paenibacillus farraposensis]|uniref:DUF4825 domain-containing protein n=1 Tax=Paenibacillus farraposensis TaxID=2807095 RepID=A0ABW4DC27_9BACL|nr:hypothetical protein [Paenibacillus farraposensis]MCC3379712.1 hypothetical protein [Paenibacillus farraposensis]